MASGAFFAFLVNLLMPFAMIAAFMGLVKFEVATIGHTVLMFGAVLLTLVVIGFVCVLAFTISNTENFFFQLDEKLNVNSLQ